MLPLTRTTSLGLYAVAVELLADELRLSPGETRGLLWCIA